jgi:hypothetical protein
VDTHSCRGTSRTCFHGNRSLVLWSRTRTRGSNSTQFSIPSCLADSNMLSLVCIDGTVSDLPESVRLVSAPYAEMQSIV